MPVGSSLGRGLPASTRPFWAWFLIGCLRLASQRLPRLVPPHELNRYRGCAQRRPPRLRPDFAQGSAGKRIAVLRQTSVDRESLSHSTGGFSAASRTAQHAANHKGAVATRGNCEQYLLALRSEEHTSELQSLRH